MGAGRKTSTYTFDSSTKVPPQYRDLNEDLCGVIFGTTKDTIDECINGKLFGLPRMHYRYVKNITDGMPLFLFNYTDKLLHGVFEADGEGDLDIDPNAWSSSSPNGYPAQVRVRVLSIGKPLPESVFQNAIKDNYYSDRHFMFELDRKQVDALLKLFTVKPKSKKNHREVLPPPVLSSTTSYPVKNAWTQQSQGKLTDGGLPSSSSQKKSLSVPPRSLPHYGLGKSTSEVGERLGSGAESEHLAQKLSKINLEEADMARLEKEAVDRFRAVAASKSGASELKPVKTDKATDKWKNSRSSTPSTTAANYWDSLTKDHNGTPSSTWDTAESPRARNWENGRNSQTTNGWDPSDAASNPSTSSGPWNTTSTAPLSPPPPPVNAVPHNQSTPVSHQSYNPNANSWDIPNAPPSTGGSGLNGLYSMSNPPSSNDWHHGGHGHNLGTHNSSIHNFAAPVTSQAPLTVSGQTLTTHPGYQPLNISSSLQYSSVPLNGSAGNLYPQNVDLRAPSPPLHKVSSWEAQTRDQMQQEQSRLRNDRISLAEKLQGVDSQVAQSIQTNMEAYATAINQMRQESMEVRRLKDEMKAQQRQLMEVDKLVAHNVMLQQKQAVMEQQIQALLSSVGVMKPKFDEWVKQEEEDESAERMEANEAREVNDAIPEKVVLDVENVKPEAQEAIIYLMGGFKDDKWLDTVASFSPTTGQWKQVASMSKIRSCAAAAVLDSRIFVMGGGDGLTWYNSVEMYEKERDSWIQCAPLQKSRGSLAGAVCQGNLYALGGGDGREMFDDVEYFAPVVNQWRWTAPMRNKRFCMAAAELNGTLYALGGYDGSAYLTSMERFDPREGIWSYTAPMKSKRGSLSVAVLNEKMYAFGGFDGGEFLDSMEVYDPRADRWEMAPSMAHRRAYGGAAVIGNNLYSLGGLSGQLHIEQWSTDSLKVLDGGLGGRFGRSNVFPRLEDGPRLTWGLTCPLSGASFRSRYFDSG